MKKIIAVAFSDLHLNDWAKFNKEYERTKNHFKVLSLIRQICQKENCPALFCGDLLHKPENISNDLLKKVMRKINNLKFQYQRKPFHIYAISGNHDISSSITVDKDNKVKEYSSWVNTFADSSSFLVSLDFTHKSINKNVEVYGIPYLDHNLGLNQILSSLELDKTKKSILLLHTDYPGAKDTDGSEVGTSENININSLDKFDLVLMGHIHKPQRLSKKVYMIGAPLQQRRTDKNCELGYWNIYEDLTLEFIPLDQFPKFIDVNSEDEIQDDGNYYTVIQSTVNEEVDKAPILNKKLSKKKLIRRYLKEKGIKDEKKEHVLLNLIKESEND